MNAVLKTLAASAFLLIAVSSLSAQSCLTRDDINSLLVRSNSPQKIVFNKKLQSELIKIALRNDELLTDLIRAEEKKKDPLKKRLNEANQKAELRLCEVLKQFGWPTKELVDMDGVVAAYQILRSSSSYELQRDLLPVISAVVKKDDSQKPSFAGLIDRLRVSAGMKQLFGTQAVMIHGFLVLYPIEDETHLEERRKQFGLVPMAENTRSLEREYQAPLVKARDVPTSQLVGGLQASVSDAIKSTILDAPSISEDDVIQVNTNLVNLNVSVFNAKLKSYVGALTKDDFRVLEDGHEETISFFASTDVPFDLVLLLDLSGSTSSKRDIIRQSTRKFIETARPSDRIAIVTFTDTPKVVCELTSDRAKLLDGVKDISGSGGTSVWDALKFVMDSVVGTPNLERRRAIVMMTDGVDNSMGPFGGSDVGSRISFADLLEAVRQNDTLIVPIYLDTEGEDFSNDWTKKMYANARLMLQTLAQESGGSYYKSRRVSDLNGVYEQVINDLGKIYSLGYKPTNEKRDGTWRRVEVQIVNRADLLTHSRPGYYAK